MKSKLGEMKGREVRYRDAPEWRGWARIGRRDSQEAGESKCPNCDLGIREKAQLEARGNYTKCCAWV